jgi:site-specific recombinase XerD
MAIDLVHQHLDYLRRKNCSPRTRHDREGALRRLAAYLDKPLVEATAEDLDSWQSSLRVSISAIATYTSHVASFYRWALEQGHLDSDPATLLPRPRIPRRFPRPIPEQDLRVAITCATEPLRTWLVLAAYCGLRAGEIARMETYDVSNEGDIWTLLVRGKGDRERFVPLPVAIRSVLAAHMTGGGPMFRRPDGRPFTPDGVSEKASDHLHGLGQPHTLHTLRHRFATRLFGLSKDIRVTQEMLGHASPSTTAIYVKHSVVPARSNLDRLSKELSGV